MLKIKPHLDRFGFDKGLKLSLPVETKVWEKDWRFILKQGFIKQVMLGVGRAATKRLLLINNVDSPTSVARYADQLIKDGVLDNYVFVDDYAAAALEFFCANPCFSTIKLCQSREHCFTQSARSNG